MSSERVARPEVAAGWLRQLVEECDDAVVTVDGDGRVQEWNPAATALFGWSRDEALGQDVVALVPAGRRGAVRDRFEALRRGEELPAFEGLLEGPSGTRRLVRIRFVALTDDQQGFAGAMGLARPLDEGMLHSRRLLRLVDALPVNVVAFNHLGVITFTAGGSTTAGTLVSSELAPGVDLLRATPAGSPLHDAVRGALSGVASDVELMLGREVWRCHVAPLDGLEADDLSPGPPSGGFLLGVDLAQPEELPDRMDLVLGGSPVCLVTFDRDATVTYAAGSGYRALGVRPSSMVGQNLVDLYGENPEVAHALHATLAGQTCDIVATYQGRFWDVHYRPLPGPSGSPAGGLVIATEAGPWRGPDDDRKGDDTSPLSSLERDDLTSLLGRRGLLRRLAHPLRPDEQRAVALVELDGFALVRDAYGTSASDEVLRILAGRLREVLPEQVQLGRWESDAFLAVLDGARAAADLEKLSARLLAVCQQTVALGALPIHLTVSIGLADSRTVRGADLLGSARAAVRAAKAEGGDRLRWFRAEMLGERPAPLLILSDLRRLASTRDFSEFVLHYQPVVELATQRVAGLEALVRWQHPTHGLLGPDRFISAVEAAGLMQDLGPWILRESCRAAASLQAATGRALAVAVNLSAQQLAQPDLVDLVAATLEAEQCPATSLVLEVTERSVTEDVGRTAAALERLKSLGVRIALDDFGTGHSSLLYLKHFPVDVIKIDRSFVAGLGSSPDDSAIVASTVSMAGNLGVRCVAEGIETMDQFRLLRTMDCRYGQGYFFSRPQPLEAVSRWLEEHTEADGPDRRSAARPPREPAEVVSRVLTMHRDGASLHTIAAALNSHGIRTARGSRWSSQSIAKVITASQFPRLRLPE